MCVGGGRSGWGSLFPQDASIPVEAVQCAWYDTPGLTPFIQPPSLSPSREGGAWSMSLEGEEAGQKSLEPWVHWKITGSWAEITGTLLGLLSHVVNLTEQAIWSSSATGG